MAATAEVQRLLAVYEVQDRSAAGVASATGGLTRLEGVSSRLSGLGTKLGGAFQFAGNRLKGLATAGLGLLGIGGGLSIIAAFKTGISTAQDFGDEVVRLARLSGLTIPVASALASAFHHYGIESETAAKVTGFLERSLGTLWLKKKAVVGFEQQFGISLRDSNHHLADSHEILLRLSDFWNNKGIPQAFKAVALQQLLGKSWQQLIPFLSAGRKGIADVESEAARLGLTLTKDNIEALKKSKEATRDWKTALGGLELQLGLALLPRLTAFTKTATDFVVNHKADILGFFNKAADFVGTFADALSRIPSGLGITDMIKGAIQAWDDLPDGLRDLLVKGVVADRSIKFLFGVSPIGAIGSAIGGALGGGIKSLLGSIFQRGGTPATPLFVKDVGLGALAGKDFWVRGAKGRFEPGGTFPAGGAAGAGGLGAVGGLLALGGVAIALVGVAELLRQNLHPFTSGDFVQNRTNAERISHETGSPLVSPAQLKTNAILNTIAYREQRLGEITGGKSDILAARTNAAIDAVERARAAVNERGEVTASRLAHANDTLEEIRNKRWEITNNLTIPITVARSATMRLSTFNSSDTSGTFDTHQRNQVT